MQTVERRPHEKRTLWLKWTLWIAIAWTVAIVVKDAGRLSHESYPSWFLIELVITLPAAILQLIVSAVIAGIATIIVALVRRGDVAHVWGAPTPFSKGLAWALGIGVALGLLMMYGQTNSHG